MSLVGALFSCHQAYAAILIYLALVTPVPTRTGGTRLGKVARRVSHRGSILDGRGGRLAGLRSDLGGRRLSVTGTSGGTHGTRGSLSSMGLSVSGLGRRRSRLTRRRVKRVRVLGSLLIGCCLADHGGRLSGMLDNSGIAGVSHVARCTRQVSMTEINTVSRLRFAAVRLGRGRTALLGRRRQRDRLLTRCGGRGAALRASRGGHGDAISDVGGHVSGRGNCLGRLRRGRGHLGITVTGTGTGGGIPVSNVTHRGNHLP